MSIKKIKKINQNIWIFISVLVLIWLTMFIFNSYTYYVADDYSYMNSFVDSQRIKNVLDIFPSMYAHAFSMNGRLVAHFFVQLFLMLPPIIFDLTNSFMFIFLVLIFYKYFFGEKEVNTLGLLMIFAVIWYFTPAFGQVMLWLDGSCNYLWAATFALWYLYPYVALLREKNLLKSVFSKWIFVLSGILVGGYLETISFGTIFIAVMILAMCKLKKKKRIPLWAKFSIGCMMTGFFLMMFAPGTLKNKVAVNGINGYISNFLQSLDMYYNHLIWPLVIFIILIILAIIYEKQNVEISLIFFFSSLITNFMHSVAAYYPERNMLASTLFLIAAIVFLLKDFWEMSYGLMITCACWILFVFAGVQFLHGGYDIYMTYQQCMERNELIEVEKQNGNLNIELPVISATTKYSAKYGLSDLDTQTCWTWCNVATAKYYGLESILGIDE